MFDLTEQRVVSGELGVVEGVLPGVVQGAALLPLATYAPGTWQGRSPAASWGLFTVVATRISPAPAGTLVELRIGAEAETTSIVIGLVLLFLFWPVALLLGYLAYDDFQKRRARIQQAVWMQLGAPPQPALGAYGLPPSG